MIDKRPSEHVYALFFVHLLPESIEQSIYHRYFMSDDQPLGWAKTAIDFDCWLVSPCQLITMESFITICQQMQLKTVAILI